MFWMGQQDDVVEEVAEVPVFVRLALEAGQHGAKGSCYEFLIVVFHRAYLVQRDVEAHGADELAVLGDHEAFLALAPEEGMGGIAEQHHLFWRDACSCAVGLHGIVQRVG